MVSPAKFSSFNQIDLITGAHAILMRLWGEKSGPCMQVLHAAFALGAFLAPLIAKPFITDIPDTQENLNTSLVFNISCSNAWTSNCDNISSVECACIDSIAEICSETSSAIVVLSTTSNCSVIEEQTDSITLKYGWAYWISALFFVIPLLVFIYYSIRFDIIPRFKTNRNNDISKVGRQTEESLETTKAEESPEGSQVELNEVAAVDNEKLLEEDGNIVVVKDSTSSKGPVVLKTYKYPAFFLLFWFMLFYVGSEVSYGSLLFTFSVKSQLQFDKQTAATVTAVFWGLLMFMRVFSILLVVLKVRASVMMTLNVSGSVTAILILAIFPHNHISVWIASSLLGASFSSVFPMAMTWMSEHLPVSGKATAVLNGGANIGDIVLPSVIAALIGNVHPDYFVYSILTLITLSTTLLVLLFTMTFVYQRRHKPHDKSLVGYNRLQIDSGESLENGGLISSGVFEETEPTENEEATL